MTDHVYPKAKEQMLQGGANLAAGDVRVMLVADSYAYDAAHEFVADLGSVDNGRSAALASKTFVDAVFKAANTTLDAVTSITCDALVLFLHTGDDATARLVAYIDEASGLPFTPEVGQACPIAWDPAGIFTL